VGGIEIELERERKRRQKLKSIENNRQTGQFSQIRNNKKMNGTEGQKKRKRKTIGDGE
jgi:hypothetical protein